MDPVTHGLLGAAVSQVFFSKKLGPTVWRLGALAAVLPDVDVFIRSRTNPLLFIEYHRHFTHALLFIPMGGLIAALPWLLGRRHRHRWKAFLGAATISYATHGLLDACTTYGTLLLWPFSMTRISWDCLAIVDPIFTLFLVLGVALTARWRQGAPALIAILFCLAYIGLGVFQRERARSIQDQLVQTRGHTRVRGKAFPTVGNNFLWRSLYEAEGQFYSDGIRIPWWSRSTYAPGSHVLALKDLPPALAWWENARIEQGFKVFYWFCDGWTAYTPTQPGLIGDLRFSPITYGFQPIWGIRIDPAFPDQPVRWVNDTMVWRSHMGSFWREVTGRSPAYRPVSEERRAKSEERRAKSDRHFSLHGRPEGPILFCSSLFVWLCPFASYCGKVAVYLRPAVLGCGLKSGYRQPAEGRGAARIGRRFEHNAGDAPTEVAVLWYFGIHQLEIR